MKKNIDIAFNEDISNLELPIPVPDESILQELFQGNHIAIVDGQIIAVDPSIRNIHKKIEDLISRKKICHIQWIDEEFAIYGTTL